MRRADLYKERLGLVHNVDKSPGNSMRIYEGILADHKNGHLSNLFVCVKMEIDRIQQEALVMSRSVNMELGLKNACVVNKMAQVDALTTILNMPEAAEKELDRMRQTKETE